jgi:hypothetical protein
MKKKDLTLVSSRQQITVGFVVVVPTWGLAAINLPQPV